MSRKTRHESLGEAESKWEPQKWDPTRSVQNPEETLSSTRNHKGTIHTVSVPVKIQRQWLAELTRLEDPHTVTSALDSLRTLSTPTKMPLERLTPFLTQFSPRRDHQFHRPYTRRACVNVFQHICEDRGPELSRHVKRLSNCICEYCEDEDAGVRRSCVLAYQSLVVNVIGKLGPDAQHLSLQQCIEPPKNLLQRSHNPHAQDGASMCLAMILDCADGMRGAENCSSRLLPVLVKRLKRSNSSAKASVLNALSACVCRSGDRFATHAVAIVTAVLLDVQASSDRCGGWQGKKCAIDIITQIGESIPLPVELLQDINESLDKNRFDKVPAIRNCVKDAMAVYQKALNEAIEDSKEKATVIKLPGEEGLGENMKTPTTKNKTSPRFEDRDAPNSSQPGVAVGYANSSRKNKVLSSSAEQSFSTIPDSSSSAAKTFSQDRDVNRSSKSKEHYLKDALRSFAQQQKSLRKDFDMFREETKLHFTALQRQVNMLERSMGEVMAYTKQLDNGPHEKKQLRYTLEKRSSSSKMMNSYRSEEETVRFSREGKTQLDVGTKSRRSRAGEAQESFEQALNTPDDRQFIQLVGAVDVRNLSTLALTTQKRVLLKMLQSMEKKQFIGQYLPWFEEAVRIGIQQKVFSGPGVYQRTTDLLENLKERRLLNKFKMRAL